MEAAEVWPERPKKVKRALAFLELGVTSLAKILEVDHLAEADMEPPQNPLMVELKNLRMEEAEEMEIKVEGVYLVDYQGLEVSF